jgi:hypothetical protein
MTSGAWFGGPHATCQISKLWALKFLSRRYFKDLFLKSIFSSCDLLLQQTGTINKIFVQDHLRIIPVKFNQNECLWKILFKEIVDNNEHSTITNAHLGALCAQVNSKENSCFIINIYCIIINSTTIETCTSDLIF